MSKNIYFQQPKQWKQTEKRLEQFIIFFYQNRWFLKMIILIHFKWNYFYIMKLISLKNNSNLLLKKKFLNCIPNKLTRGDYVQIVFLLKNEKRRKVFMLD